MIFINFNKNNNCNTTEPNLEQTMHLLNPEIKDVRKKLKWILP